MKTLWKVFELIEVSTMNEWEADTLTHTVMLEWFETDKINSELEAQQKLQAALDHEEVVAFRSNNRIGFEIKKVLVQ